MFQNPLLTVNAAENVPVARPNVPLPPRSVHTNALKYTPEFDVLVIGGGATGCGVALDAVTRGKRKKATFLSFFSNMRSRGLI